MPRSEAVSDGIPLSKFSLSAISTTIGREEVAVLTQQFIEAGRSDFLFPFDQHLHVQRKFARRAKIGPDRGRVQHGACLVIRHPAAVQPAVPFRRLEGRGLPQLRAADRLHVMVGVQQDRGLARRFGPLAKTEGWPLPGVRMRTSFSPFLVNSSAAACALFLSGSGSNPGKLMLGMRTRSFRSCTCPVLFARKCATAGAAWSRSFMEMLLSVQHSIPMPKRVSRTVTFLVQA